MPFLNKILVTAALLVTCSLACHSLPCHAHEFDERLDSVMMQEPSLVDPELELVFANELASLWNAALQRPAVELQRLAADTLALAESFGMSDLEKNTDHLIAALQTPDQDITVRRAAARALIAMNAKEAASLLAEQSESANPAIALVVEPALGRWGYEPMIGTWLARLDDPTTERIRLKLAIRGLQERGEKKAMSGLLQIATSGNVTASLRLAAARALVSIEPAGQTEFAETSLDNELIVERLIGCTLLGQGKDANTIKLLKSYAEDKSSVVVAAALNSLLAVDPKIADEFSVNAFANSDVNVRRLGAKAVTIRGDVKSIEQLSVLLNDPNPTLRRQVANAMLALSKKDELRITVVDASMQVLAADDWRGLHESVIILGTLQHREAAARMIELLRHRRPPVAAAAAWGVRRVGDPSYLDGLNLFAQQLAAEVMTGKATPARIAVIDFQLGQIIQSFGQHNYAASAPLLLKVIPKKFKVMDETRSAAIWTLGKLYQDSDDVPNELLAALESRLSDVSPSNPESVRVRRMSAIAIGRMKSEASLKTLKEMAETETGTIIAVACYWAIERITGEQGTTPRPRRLMTDWFLAPLTQ